MRLRSQGEGGEWERILRRERRTRPPLTSEYPLPLAPSPPAGRPFKPSLTVERAAQPQKIKRKMKMKIDLEDTIAAISTPIGSGGIGIVRLSGDKSVEILDKIFRTASGKKAAELASHTITYGKIISHKKTVDEVLVSFMKAPKTYTRQDVVEINCHGGVQAVNSVLRACLDAGARLAEPGEFTKRAFLNGRIDLLQAEAVSEIISSKTENAKRAALSKLGGRLSGKIKELREQILSAEAAVEAAIEYPEHDDEIVTRLSARQTAGTVLEGVRELISRADFGRIIQNGINCVIMGRPNVGKSSFLNYILDEERAIVTDIPGTTRDVLSESVSIEGIPLNITDTAGIRQTGDVIEKIGVDRSFEYGENADIIFMMIDGSEKLTEDDFRILDFIKNRRAIIIINKSDKKSEVEPEELEAYAEKENIITVSIKQNHCVEDIFRRLKAMFLGGEIEIDDSACVIGERTLESLKKAEISLMNVIDTVDSGFPEDFISMDFTDAYAALGEITGETLEEDVIDKIFSEFCLGK